VIVRDIAHARAGDKGNTSQISAICFDPADYETLRASLTAERVAAAFAGVATGEVTRHELPGLAALVFILEGALGGGVSISLASDPHGKSLSSVLLAIEID
jgi:hypothetical protein